MPDNPYTVDHLIEKMRVLGFLPAGTGLTTSQILALMTDELGLYMPALLKSIREEFLVASVDLPVTQAAVVIPARACGAALRTIAWLNSDGSATPLARIEPERRGEYGLISDRPAGYIFQGSNVILVPAVSSGTLRVAYQQRPGILVPPEYCGQVTDIDVNTNTVTVDAVPTTFTELQVYDLVSGTPNFDALAIEQDVIIDDEELTFGSLPDRLAVGDYVAVAGQTPIPQMPTELHAVLAQRTAQKIAEGSGSTRLPAIEAGLKQARADAIALLSPRSDGSSRPIVSRSGAGARRGWW